MNLTITHVLRADAQSLETTHLEEQLRSFWELESLGIHNEEKTLYDDFASHIAFYDGRYQVSLPRREFHKPLPTMPWQTDEFAMKTQARARDFERV